MTAVAELPRTIPPIEEAAPLPAAASSTLGQHVRTAARRLGRQAIPLTVALTVLIGIWELVYLTGIKPTYVLPAPADVLSSLRESLDSGRLASAVELSVSRGLEAFVLAAFIATLIGIAVSQSTLLRLAVRPLLSGMMTMPSVAWVPASILWFGLSARTVFAVVLLGSVPAIANSLISAIDGVPPILMRAGRVIGARRFFLARKVILPAALPGYLGGLRSGWAFAWHALMTAEVIAISPKIGVGLGQLLEQSREYSDIAGVFAAMAMILLVGVLVDRLVFAPVESFVNTRRGLGRP